MAVCAVHSLELLPQFEVQRCPQPGLLKSVQVGNGAWLVKVVVGRSRFGGQSIENKSKGLKHGALGIGGNEGSGGTGISPGFRVG